MVSWSLPRHSVISRFEEATAGRIEDRQKIDDLLVEYSNLEAEINLIKRRIELLEEEILILKKENNRLMAELQRVRIVSFCSRDGLIYRKFLRNSTRRLLLVSTTKTE